MAILKNKTILQSQPVWQQIIIVLLFNSLVAIVLHLIKSEGDLSNQLILSQSIGLSIFLSFHLFDVFFEIHSWGLFIPLILGSGLGISIVILIQAMQVNADISMVIRSLKQNHTNILSTMFIALFFGAVILVYFINRENIFLTKEKLQAEKITNLNQKKIIAETRLQMLQAQIEPHFLFNSLSNVISLIENNPVKSKLLLESLTDFLRASLRRSTDEQKNLRNEISLISNYLDIMKIRIGKRLKYNIQLQDDIIDCVFPPLLLQPLVENAIIHGIEPLAEGGTIDISISKVKKKLIIQVADTGKGLSDKNINSFGLKNIRERLSSIYGNEGHLLIEENKPCGVIASIEVPYEKI